MSGVGHASHYRWMASDPEYPAKFEQAHLQSCDALEAEAFRRAVEGHDEPVYWQGACIGYRKKFSDQILLRLLESRLPEKYGNRSELTHKGNVAASVQVDLPESDPDHRSLLDELHSEPEYLDYLRERAMRADAVAAQCIPT